MIKGAKYSWGGKWFTFVRPHMTWKNYGWFRDDDGQMLTIRTDVFEAAEPKEPEPFPEPERWEQHDGWVEYVKVEKDGKGFCTASPIASKFAVDTHNAEIDRLMREIRRLEALVNKK
jgi:ABC-type glycerol-3-phosphate transport system substrate-binding protein